MNRIAIIDYGMGNLHSVASALALVSPESEILVTGDHEQVSGADRIIFPGVGAIRDCMAEIRRLGFDTLVPEQIRSGKPVLAICVGMQALMRKSEENGGVDCIGFFDGDVEFFLGNDSFNEARREEPLKVPHMGWNEVWQKREHPLWQGIADRSRFYFVHSFFVRPEDSRIEIGSTTYGLEFCSAIAERNLFAVQFHPEKSHDAGLQLLRNFVRWNGRE